MKRRLLASALSYFNSSIVRLKEGTLTDEEKDVLNFNSSIVRLKVFAIRFKSCYFI